MISVKNIEKKYSNKKVVDNLSLDIQKGKITSIIGPNGAGKSTFLGMISRTIKESGGSVLIDDINLSNWKSDELSKKLAILKQSENISLKITVKDLVSFGRFPYSKGRLNSDDNIKIEEALLYMDLKDIEDKYIDELSGGQRQRAFIAAILAQDTDYILLDEPLNNLDIKYASDMLKILKKMVHELGKTIVLVIHDINFAATYSDHIILLKDGKLAKEGSVEEIMKEEVLKSIYDMEFEIIKLENSIICSYY